MIRRKRSASDIAVPQNVYRHLQAEFAESNARKCVEYERNRIFHPGDAFIDVLRWLWGGIDSPLRSGERVLRARSWLTTLPPSTPSSQSRSLRRRR